MDTKRKDKKDIMLTARIPRTLLAGIRAYMRRNHQSRSTVVRAAIERHLTSAGKI